MYAVGVMIGIFLLLSGISFNRRSELRKMDDYLQKRDECLKISNTIASLTSSGFNTRSIFSVRYPTRIYPDGRILIDPSTTGDQETPCTYVGSVKIVGGSAYLDLTSGQTYCFFTLKDQVSIFEDGTYHWTACCTLDEYLPLCK